MTFGQKSKDIIEMLERDLFAKIDEDELYDKEYARDGTVLRKCKKKVSTRRNEILPIISPTRIQTRLESILRLYAPKTTMDAKDMAAEEFLVAYTEYCKIIDFINEYIVFKTTKQNFCAFAEITVDTYNELMQDPKFSNTLKWINDGLVGANFIDSASGLYDSRSIINEAQTKDAGLNLIKNPEAIVYKGNTFINHQEVDKQLAMFEGMVKSLPQNKK